MALFLFCFQGKASGKKGSGSPSGSREGSRSRSGSRGGGDSRSASKEKKGKIDAVVCPTSQIFHFSN